jgi:Protein of unknown function (DUF2971)
MIRLPKTLYKYRRFSGALLQSLVDHTVYYADPKKFNDPLEANPPIIDFDGEFETSDLELLCDQVHGDRGLRRSNLQYMSGEHGDYRSDQAAADWYRQSLVGSVKDQINLEFFRKGILSLSARWDSTLMWSHYADEHRGVCFGYTMDGARFENLKSAIYGSSRRIAFTDVYDWKINNSEEAKRRVYEAAFFTKASSWRYEKEWRDMSEKHGSQLSPAKLTEIVFGTRCELAAMKATISLFSESDPTVKFFEAVFKRTNLTLKRVKVDRDYLANCCSVSQYVPGSEFDDLAQPGTRGA